MDFEAAEQDAAVEGGEGVEEAVVCFDDQVDCNRRLPICHPEHIDEQVSQLQEHIAVLEKHTLPIDLDGVPGGIANNVPDAMQRLQTMASHRTGSGQSHEGGARHKRFNTTNTRRHQRTH